MLAIWHSDTATVECLLKHSAAVGLEYIGGWTGWTMAVPFGPEEVVRTVAENEADLRQKFASGIPAIYAAARRDTLSSMLEFPSKIALDQQNDEASSAVLPNIPLTNFKCPVNAGAKLEIQDTVAGDTPLANAAYNNQLEYTEYPLKLGANINLVSPCYCAPLHQAHLACSLSMMKLLIKHWADPNYPCEDAVTGAPLQAEPTAHDAKNSRVDEMVDYLIAKGADVTAEGGLFRFPINAAAFQGTPTLISRLVNNGATIDVMDQTIVDLGGDINSWDEMGRTAAHWASQPGRSQVVEMIMSSTAERQFVNIPDIDGWTSLFWAARGTRSLLDKGVAGEPQDQTKVIKLLLQRGADRSILVSATRRK